MTDQQQYVEYVDAPRQQVDRKRRFRFVASVVGFSLAASTLLVLLGVTSPALVMLIEGLVTLATVLSVWYVSGSVVDYNGGFGGMIRGGKHGTQSGPKGTGLKPPR